MVRYVSLELKDNIIDRILDKRNGAMFSFDYDEVREEFGLDDSLFLSFLRELEALGMLSKVSGTKSSVIAFTNTSFDTFYENGGFVKQNSIKQLLEDKLMFEVNSMIQDDNIKSKPELLGKLKDIVVLIESGMTILTLAQKTN